MVTDLHNYDLPGHLVQYMSPLLCSRSIRIGGEVVKEEQNPPSVLLANAL
jgi:hypothetical protein